MAELSQEQKFKIALAELTKNSVEFNKHGGSEVAFTNKKVSPSIKNKKYLSPKEQDQLLALCQRYINKTL